VSARRPAGGRPRGSPLRQAIAHSVGAASGGIRAATSLSREGLTRSIVVALRRDNVLQPVSRRSASGGWERSVEHPVHGAVGEHANAAPMRLRVIGYEFAVNGRAGRALHVDESGAAMHERVASTRVRSPWPVDAICLAKSAN
jgi:hypothetical protein